MLITRYNAAMFGESFDLAGVLNRLKQADKALMDFIAPLWPGVTLAVAWMEQGPRVFQLEAPPAQAGYYLLETREETAYVLREADANDAQRYRNYLERAGVILLEHDLAYPESFAERLQGITAPRPILFAQGLPLQHLVARFDGINLFCESVAGETSSSPLDGLFSGNAIFTPGEMLGVPGQEGADNAAEQAQDEMRNDPNRCIEYQLKAVIEPAGGQLTACVVKDGACHVSWRSLAEAHDVVLASPVSPITSGICLPGARGFDSSALTRVLIEHALDAWK